MTLAAPEVLAQNRLLSRLPPAEAELVRREARVLDLELGTTVFAADAPTDQLLFPIGGVISALTVTADGESIEAVLTGREGVIGGSALLGPVLSPWRLVVQVPGQVVSCALFLVDGEPAPAPRLRRRVLNHVGVLLRSTSQTIACNRFHLLDERAARWLALVFDAADSDSVAITHDFLAQMLGVHRPSVTLALRSLERAGVIELGRGAIRLADQGALAAAACECYSRIRSFSGGEMPF